MENSLVHVLTSLQKWARDISAWDLIQGIDLLMKPINQRFVRPEQPRIALFVVLEGPDFAGKLSTQKASPCGYPSRDLRFRL